jgi:hypothetical protein
MPKQQGTIVRKIVLGAICALMAGADLSSHAQGAAPVAALFTPYVGCHAAGGPAVVQVAALEPGETTRSLPLVNGNYALSMLDGRRVMFAYPKEDYYANVKVEILPAQGYADSKAALIGNFEYVLGGGDNERNYKLKPKLNGFDIQGLDRTKREGGVLGLYLLFDDPTHTVVTIYFLNQEPPKRFKTMEEYAVLRDQFLDGYTSCVRNSLGAARTK